MSERVAIVAGAGGELGRATAEKLAAAGFTVAGVDRSEQGLNELPDGIRREAADPTDPAAARSVVDRIAAEVGPPEVLVNTIGAYQLGEALAATPEDLRLMIDVNVGAALWLTQAVVPYLRERGSGSVVHVAARPGMSGGAVLDQAGRLAGIVFGVEGLTDDSLVVPATALRRILAARLARDRGCSLSR